LVIQGAAVLKLKKALHDYWKGKKNFFFICVDIFDGSWTERTSGCRENTFRKFARLPFEILIWPASQLEPQPGLPDFSYYKVPNPEKLYQITTNYTKCP
jgi:hypothetical protein